MKYSLTNCLYTSADNKQNMAKTIICSFKESRVTVKRICATVHLLTKYIFLIYTLQKYVTQNTYSSNITLRNNNTNSASTTVSIRANFAAVDNIFSLHVRLSTCPSHAFDLL